MLDIALEKLDAGMLASACFDELAADVEPDAVVARPPQQMSERAGAAAEIDHPRAGRERAQAHERVDEARSRLRGKDIVVVGGRMAVEERDLPMLVLLPVSLVSQPVSSLDAEFVFCGRHRSSMAHAGGCLRCRR